MLSCLHQITALHIAAERGHIKIVEYLADKGADVDIQDKNGVSVHDHSNDSVDWNGFEPTIRGNLITHTMLVYYMLILQLLP